MLSYERKGKPMWQIQWPHKPESFSPSGRWSIQPSQAFTMMKSELHLLSVKHSTVSTEAHTQWQLLAISHSSTNCLNLVVSSFLPQPSSYLLSLIYLSQNLIFIPVTRAQMPTYWLFLLWQIQYIFSSLLWSQSPEKTAPSPSQPFHSSSWTVFISFL